MAGFAYFRCFWALRPAIQAQAAIVLVVSLAPPRRLRGSMAFHRPRPSLRSGALFHRPGLTRRSSGLAYGHPLSLHVSPLFSSAAQPMLLPSSVTPSKPHSLGRGRCGGLRLFQVFLVATARYSGSSSYRFSSSPCTAAPPPWQHGASQAAPVFTLGRVVSPPGSNPALKRTGLRPAA